MRVCKAGTSSYYLNYINKIIKGIIVLNSDTFFDISAKYYKY